MGGQAGPEVSLQASEVLHVPPQGEAVPQTSIQRPCPWTHGHRVLLELTASAVPVLSGSLARKDRLAWRWLLGSSEAEMAD